MCPTAAEGKMPSGQPAGRRRYQTRSSKRSSARLCGAGAPARVSDCGAVTRGRGQDALGTAGETPALQNPLRRAGAPPYAGCFVC